MKMKRFLCLMLCLMMILGQALAADPFITLPETFNAQFITGGFGVRGYVNLKASGVAPWLDVLLPFTATQIQLRAIGREQGDYSDLLNDDDDWQLKLYMKDAANTEKGVTYLYGDPDAMYISSELLPETLLTLPVKDVHLLYDIAKRDIGSLLFGFDPFAMTGNGAGGNASAYEAIASVLGVPEEEYKAKWAPVLQKYFLDLDMWLTGYGETQVAGAGNGALSMSVTYAIPARDVKAKAKYLVGQMLFDSELQNLLIPYVSVEDRALYLNSSLIYFYEACIDAIPLEGDVILSREMSALGEVIATSVSLPLPNLPATITEPCGKLIAELFALPYHDAFTGINRIVLKQESDESTLSLNSEKRTITLSIDETAANAESTTMSGFIRITPAIGIDEPPLFAAFTFKTSHTIYQDDEYNSHDDTTFSLSINPDLDLISTDDPFRNAYLDFSPVSMSVSMTYYQETVVPNRPVQINIDASAQLPDAYLEMEMVLRTTNKWNHANLPTDGAVDISSINPEEKDALLDEFVANAVMTIANMSQPTAVPEPTATPAPEMPEIAEPTAVPPMAE